MLKYARQQDKTQMFCKGKSEFMHNVSNTNLCGMVKYKCTSCSKTSRKICTTAKKT